MTHLYIELNTGLTEEVNSSIISKLYELAISGDLDSTSDLKGRLHSATGYDILIAYLNEHFQDLHISVDIAYVTFEDPTMQQILSLYIGDGQGVSVQDITSFTGYFGDNYYNNNTNKYLSPSNNTLGNLKDILTFDEFERFRCTGLVQYMFLNNPKLSSITLPNTLTHISAYAFQRDVNLQHINLDNVTSIGDACFLGCYELTSITLNAGCNTLPSTVFAECSSLEEINLNNVTTIGNRAFDQCTALLTIGSILNVTSIGSDAFRLCQLVQEFETLNLPNLQTLGAAGNGHFSRCHIIRHITNLGSIPYIGAKWEGTFFNCDNLLDAVLPESITLIDYNCFRGCTNLRYVKVLSLDVPKYILVTGHGGNATYGLFFGESYTNGDPTNTSSYNGLTFPIYVRDELLSQYQAADGWKYVGPNRLKPLSQFATDFPNE